MSIVLGGPLKLGFQRKNRDHLGRPGLVDSKPRIKVHEVSPDPCSVVADNSFCDIGARAVW